MKEFTAQQKEVIARKLGYDGPMAGFDDFIASSPALGMKYAAISNKFSERMARGGLTRRTTFADGGDTSYTNQQIIDAYNATVGAGTMTEAQFVDAARTQYGVSDTQLISARDELLASQNTGGTDTTTIGDRGRPDLASTSVTVPVNQITSTAGQTIDTANRAGAVTTAATNLAQTSTAATPAQVAAAQMQAATSQAGVTSALQDFKGVTGTVSDKAQVTAQTVDPLASAVMGQTAALGTARQVEGAPTRELQAEELVSGSAVDQARIEQTLAAAQAAQGAVTEEMTVQGQLNKLTKDFEAGNPPPWAAANLRAVTATMAARGIGASSLAGQALIQATLESALPIASADAAAYQQMASQNLSNRQQTAMLVAQQRAAFLGQEFDQNFQTRVLNAAKVADIANMNFSAKQQIALENARLAQTMDLANLSNEQAVVMAKIAQIATLETKNLDNRQQAAVENAKAFLQMDLANLANEQQASMFKAQAITQSILSDTAAENAARQFNASSTNQINQFNETLATQVSQFNAAQSNAISQFNSEQSNVIGRFNAEQTNMREQFNATQRLVIDQSNAQWEREIATANTAAQNAANLVSAQLSTNLTIAEYNNEVQMYRDQINQVWQSGENDAQRATQLAAAEISSNAAVSAASIAAAADVREAEINAASRAATTQATNEAAEDRAESEAWGRVAGAIISSVFG